MSNNSSLDQSVDGRSELAQLCLTLRDPHGACQAPPSRILQARIPVWVGKERRGQSQDTFWRQRQLDSAKDPKNVLGLENNESRLTSFLIFYFLKIYF